MGVSVSYPWLGCILGAVLGGVAVELWLMRSYSTLLGGLAGFVAIVQLGSISRKGAEPQRKQSSLPNGHVLLAALRLCVSLVRFPPPAGKLVGVKAQRRQLLTHAALVAAEFTLYAVIGLMVLVVMSHYLLLGFGLAVMVHLVLTLVRRRVLSKSALRVMQLSSS